jgi:two-component system, sensor histidine kinase
VPDSPAAAPDLAARIDHAALRIAFSRLLLSVAFTLVTSLVFIGLLLPHFPRTTLAWWFAGIQATGLGRLGLWYWHRRADPGMDATRSWERRFFLGTMAAALSWSAGGLWLFPEGSNVEVAVLCVTLLGVSSIAVSSLAAHFPSLLVFVSTALAPLAVQLLRSEVSVARVVGMLLITCGIALAWTGWQSTLVLRKLLRTELELQGAIDETRAAQQAAEKANEAKSRFLATMSHEVRTPLNGILGLAELLEGSALDAPQRRQLQLLRKSGDNLREIVDDILDFSRIEADRMPIASTGFGPRRIAEEAFETWKERARQAGLAMRLEASLELPDHVLGDPVRLRQILDNFIGNALKFTARGGIELRVEADGRGPFTGGGAVRLRFSVRDTGIGIPPEAIERIFDPFTQADQSWSRAYGGSGLGLAICRSLVTRMGGMIGVDSTPGLGSTFWISLPLRVAAPALADALAIDDARADALLSTAAGEPVARPTSRVLMVEDNAVNRTVCGAMLERLGLDFDEAFDGVEALAKAVDRHYDLVLMDCQMPQLDGYAATRELRARGIVGRDGRPLPIIALTANAFAEDRERARAAGMDDFLSKPVTLEQLRVAVSRWTTVAADGSAAQGDAAPAETPSAAG